MSVLSTLLRPIVGSDPLPKSSRLKLQNLQLAVDDDGASIQRLSEQVRELRVERMRISNIVESWQAPVIVAIAGDGEKVPELHRDTWKNDPSVRTSYRKALPEEDPRIRAELEKLRQIEAEIARLNGIISGRKERIAANQQLLRHINFWLEKLPKTNHLPAHSTVDVKFGRGEAPADAVERIRRRVRELQADLARIRVAPLTSAAAKKLAHSEIDRLVAAGRPSVLPVVGHGGDIRWPEVTRQNVHEGLDGSPVLQITHASYGVAILAWLLRDQLVAAIDREIDEVEDDENALDDATRTAKERQMLSDLLATEREEEGLIELAAESGVQVLHRPDADPRAVLGLASTLPAPRE